MSERRAAKEIKSLNLVELEPRPREERHHTESINEARSRYKFLDRCCCRLTVRMRLVFHIPN